LHVQRNYSGSFGRCQALQITQEIEPSVGFCYQGLTERCLYYLSATRVSWHPHKNGFLTHIFPFQHEEGIKKIHAT
jgi:hypothetical protein